MARQQLRLTLIAFVVPALVGSLTLSGQIRRARVGEEGAAVIGRQGAVVKGEEGYTAVGRRRGVVVAGEEGWAAGRRYGGIVVGNRFEDYEGWRATAGIGAAIAVGTMLARLPAAATTLAVGGTTYWRYQNTYYTRVYSGGSVAYQVVTAPR